MGSYTLIVGVLKYFLIFGGFVRFDSDPLVLSSYGAFVHFCFLCPPMWSHDENVDYPHLYHVIIWSCALIVGVLKYFLIFGGFVRFDSDPMVLSSYGAFIHFCFSLSAHVIAWRECWLSTPVSCDHLIMRLDCWSIKIFSHFWGCLVRFDSDSFRFFRLIVLLSIFAFLCPPTWSHYENVDCPHVYQVIMRLYTLICWSIKIFSHSLGVLSALILILWFFRPMVLLSIFPFLCPPTRSHNVNVDCPHLYQVIMGSYTLIVGVLKYFLIFGGFCPLWFWSFGAFVLWCFCPFLLFSVRPRDRMTKMLIIHTCIMWSFDRAPWLLEY